MTNTAVVTGAAGGIGGAISTHLETQGWRVIRVDRAWPGASRSDRLTIDLRDESEIRRQLGPLGGVTALVNNAAVMAPGSALTTTADQWDAVAEVNLRGAFFASQVLAPELARNSGAIVNVSSVHAVATSTGAAPYAASKAGLSGLTRSLAVEFASDKIRVNAVLPGAIDTDMLRSGLERADDPVGARAQLIARTPLGRVGSADDVAQAVAFLLDGDRAGFITGQQLVVDGGVLARLSSE